MPVVALPSVLSSSVMAFFLPHCPRGLSGKAAPIYFFKN